MVIGTGRDAAEQARGAAKPRPPGLGKWKLTLLGLVGIWALLAAYDLIANLGAIGANPAAAPSSASASASGGAVTPPSAAAPATSARIPPASTSPTPRALGVAAVAAFGPAGTTDGDNPGIVSRLLGASTGQPWYSQWYATPEFGGLRSGTGLLLDMGRRVAVQSVRLTLGTAPGADVQLRAGDTPSLAGLSPVTSASDVKGSVRLPVTAPVSGRYLLLWFTRLPPNGQPGEYQIDVYRVTVSGADR